MSRFLAFAVTLLLIPTFSSAYTIVLDDGSVLVAKDPYTVEDGRAVFTTPEGRLVSLPMSQIDETATQEANQRPQRETYTSMTDSHVTRTAPRKTIDNFALRGYRKVAISQDSSPPFSGGTGGAIAEGAKGLKVSRSDIQAKETQIQTLRTQINKKAEKANATQDLEARKAMAAEVEQLKGQYAKLRGEYAQMIRAYNEQLFAAKAREEKEASAGSEEASEAAPDSQETGEEESDEEGGDEIER